MICIGDPGDGGSEVEGDINGAAFWFLEEDASFRKEEGGADIVGVADEGHFDAEAGEDHGAEIAVHAVVAGEEFVELAAGGDVLVIEDYGGAGGAVEFAPEVLFELGGHGFAGGEELGERGEAVAEIVGLGDAEGERGSMMPIWRSASPGGADIDGLGDEAVAAEGADLIGAPLFAGGDFRHGGDEDIGEAGFVAELGGESGEDPGGALIVHDAAGAIDGINDAAPEGVLDFRAAREEAQGGIVEAFGDELDGPLGGPVGFEPLYDGVLAEGIDRVDGIGDGFAVDAGEIGGFAIFAAGDHLIPDKIAEGTQ